MSEPGVRDEGEVMGMQRQADLLQQLIEGFLPFTGLSKRHLLVFYHLQERDMMLEGRGVADMKKPCWGCAGSMPERAPRVLRVLLLGPLRSF